MRFLLALVLLFASPAFAEQTVKDLLDSTVRVTVKHNGQTVTGSGTVVEQHDDTALVVTCAHVFKPSEGRGVVTVDALSPVRAQLKARVLTYDHSRDVGLVVVNVSGVKLPTAAIAPKGTDVAVGMQFIGVGCNHGLTPTAHRVNVTDLNRFNYPSNFSTTVLPAHGRSGGGCFANGKLVGVYNLGIESRNEGVFAGLESIHWILDKAQASWVYEAQCSGGSCGGGGMAMGGKGRMPSQVGKSQAPAPSDGQEWPSAPSKPYVAPSTPVAPIPAKPDIDLDDLATKIAGKLPPGPMGPAGPQGPPGDSAVADQQAIVDAAVQAAIAAVKKIPFDAQLTRTDGMVEKTQVYLGGADPDGKPSALKLKLNSTKIPVTTAGK